MLDQIIFFHTPTSKILNSFGNIQHQPKTNQGESDYIILVLALKLRL